MSRALTGMGMAAALLFLWVGVADAIAKPGYTIWPASQYRFFEVDGTHGFRIFVAIYRGGTLRVELHKLRRGVFDVYTSRAASTNGRVEARIGDLGFIDMRFKPLGPFKVTPEPQGDCKGRKGLIQKGVFVGRFKMRGEGGFTAAATSRVPAIGVHSFREVCREEDVGTEGQMKPETSLRAWRRKKNDRSVVFRAASRGVMEGALEEFEARLTEFGHGLRIEHVVFGGASHESNAFTVNEGADSAAVSPPPPFMGSAVFQPKAEHDGFWTGDLKATFLGVGEVPLSGQGFRAALVMRR